MKKNIFFQQIKEMLEFENNLNGKTNLNELEEFDSLSILSIIAFVDSSFNKKISADQLSTITTVESLMKIIGLDCFE